MERRERGREIIKWLIYNGYVETQRELAASLGYNPTVLSAALTGKIPFSTKLSRNLSKAHQRISLDWLLTGEGEMLLPEDRSDGQTTDNEGRKERTAPLYQDLTCTAGQREQFGYDETHVDIRIPGITAEAFFPVSGHSMEPYIYEGDIVGVVSVDGFESINPDKTYMIITRNNERMIKHIAPTNPGEECIRLISDNAAVCPAFSIPKSDVIKIMRVVFSGRSYK